MFKYQTTKPKNKEPCTSFNTSTTGCSQASSFDVNNRNLMPTRSHMDYCFSYQNMKQMLLISFEESRVGDGYFLIKLIKSLAKLFSKR